MTVSVWRIAVETPAYTAHDLSGTRAKITGGRWNSKDSALVYSSTSVPDEYNVQIDPDHGNVRALVAPTIKRWIYDPRLFP